MRLLSGLLVLAVAGCTASSRPAAPPTPTTDAATAYRNPSQEINDRYALRVAEWVGTRAKEPAAQVFKNIQLEWLKGIPAERLILIMNVGYARALGVSCTHCHVDQDFASDEKRPKRAAREMAIMHRRVNDNLGQMENLESPVAERSINCFTCHRGAVNPNKVVQ